MTEGRVRAIAAQVAAAIAAKIKPSVSEEQIRSDVEAVIRQMQENGELTGSDLTDEQIAAVQENAEAAAGSATTASKAAAAAQTAQGKAETAQAASETAKSEAEALKNEVERKLANGDYDGADGKSAYQYARDGGFTGTEAEFAAKLAKDYDAMISDKVDKTALSLGLGSDGLLYIYVDGDPAGEGFQLPEQGQVRVTVYENNRIVLEGDSVPDGDYEFFYVKNGKEIKIGDATLDSNTYYSITSTLTKCSSSNSAKTVVEGSSYSATLTANSGYSLGTVKVTMGGTDITSSAYSNGKITIASVTGDIVITATATVNNYSITKNLTNCSISNTATGANHGASYSATISAEDGYELNSVTVTMGGQAVSVSGGVISIASVTGNIIITAVAEANGPKNLSVPSEWIVDRRLSISTGAPKDDVLSGRMITNFIPAKLDQTLEVEGLDITQTSQGQAAKIVWYKSDKTVIAGMYGSTTANKDSYALSVTTNGNVQSVKLLYDNNEHQQMMSSAAAYIRIEGVLRSGYTKEDVVITVK